MLIGFEIGLGVADLAQPEAAVDDRLKPAVAERRHQIGDKPLCGFRSLARLAEPVADAVQVQAAQCQAVVTAPRVRRHNQPLCAVYRPAFAAVAEASLRQGRNKIDPLFAEVSTRIIGEDELQQLAFDPGMFDNLNTPEDWERAAGTGKLS